MIISNTIAIEHMYMETITIPKQFGGTWVSFGSKQKWFQFIYEQCRRVVFDDLMMHPQSNCWLHLFI